MRGKLSVPPKHREELEARLKRHASKAWRSRCREVIVRFRGQFAYVDAFPFREHTPPWFTPEEKAQLEATPTKLCRLRYLGVVGRWEFAFFKYSDERYVVSYLPSGSFSGTPEECFDCAAGVYLVE